MSSIVIFILCLLLDKLSFLVILSFTYLSIYMKYYEFAFFFYSLVIYNLATKCAAGIFSFCPMSFFFFCIIY